MRISTSTLALLAMSTPAFAVSIDADSAVTAATIYPSGATITRSVNFSAPAGDNEIIIDDLPLNFDAASLRVSGEGDASFSIVSVNHRVDRLPPAADENNPERDRLEAEIDVLENQLEDLGRKIRLHRSDIDVAETRLEFVALLMEREPQKMVDDVEYTRASAKSWAETISVLTEQTRIALAAKNNALSAIEKVEDDAEDIQEKMTEKLEELAATRLPSPPRSIATVELTSAAAVSGVLQVSYRVQSAGWEPVYDLRLDQGDDATLEIERHARIIQNTGEDWERVDLTLSTARPSQRMDAPVLWSSQVSMFVAEQRRLRASGAVSNMAAPMATVKDGGGIRLSQEQSLGVIYAEEPVMMVEADGIMAEIDTQGQTVTFHMPTKATISGDGTVRQLSIDKGNVEVGLLARATPEIDTNAYLYAAMTNSFGGPILPGRASVFRDGTFVGETMMPLIAAGKEVTLPFGVLDGLEISRIVIEKEDGDFGIIGTTNRRIERYELKAESVLSYPITLTLFDRVPFSENEDLTVEAYARPQVTETDVDGKRGVRSWTFEIAPGKSQRIQFGFEINWPGDQQIIVR